MCGVYNGKTRGGLQHGYEHPFERKISERNPSVDRDTDAHYKLGQLFQTSNRWHKEETEHRAQNTAMATIHQDAELMTTYHSASAVVPGGKFLSFQDGSGSPA